MGPSARLGGVLETRGGELPLSALSLQSTLRTPKYKCQVTSKCGVWVLLSFYLHHKMGGGSFVV